MSIIMIRDRLARIFRRLVAPTGRADARLTRILATLESIQERPR